MKVSDYIVEFLCNKGLTDVFGYPGGMVTHLMDSFSKYQDRIQAHVSYHEQAAAFEACGYAQASDRAGMAYATSGPGATNLITGICNAYFDSIPVIFITGQVNTFETKGSYSVRQRGFQETDIVSMVQGVTKYAAYVEDARKIAYHLEKAYRLAMTGRKGPVLLDIPMNVQRSEVVAKELTHDCGGQQLCPAPDYVSLLESLHKAKRPCILLGAGIKNLSKANVMRFVSHMGMPVLTSMIAVDILEHEHPLSYGFIGAYGSRTANFVAAKSDLVLALGSRLDVRQVGGKRDLFAPNARLIRVDIDENELQYHVHEDELVLHEDAETLMDTLMTMYVPAKDAYRDWLLVCKKIKQMLGNMDDGVYNQYMRCISKFVPENAVITTDVGQNQVWTAQSFEVKHGQQVLFSGGHGAMGYSLPAAIGAYYATRGPVISLNGDGRIQMNLQELAFIQREKLPIKIFVFNNYALGMIRHFQEMYFEDRYVQTIEGAGYATPDFEGIAKAYGIRYLCYEKPQDVSDEFMRLEGPVFVEVSLRQNTYVFPKLEFGKPNQDQEPLIERKLYNLLMEL